MNQHLQKILDFIQQDEKLSAEEKAILTKAVKSTDSELTIAEFKLDRTEKVKRTTAILLEETIEELEQKRKAVEAQNRELEVESSLERVRAEAMGMKQKDDVLNICKIMFTELQLLGFTDLRNALINFFNDEINILQDYDYSDAAGGHIASLSYNRHPVFENFLHRIRSNTDAFAELIVDENELESWREQRRMSGEYEDPRLSGISTLYYYFYSIGVGAIGISTFSSISDEKREVLKRFRNVFDLAYRRYADISNAEAQAREAQIEAALEKVRSRTMAMQRSDELPGTAALLFQEFKKLEQLELIQTTIGLYNEEKNEIEFRATDWTGSGEQVNKPAYGSMDEPTLLKPAVTAWKTHAKSLTLELTGEALEKWTNYRNKITGTAIATKFDNGRRIVSIAFFSKGHLSMSSPQPIPAESVKTLERFAAVFDGTYTRFLDLQKAEAQARESQIEAALERVRSRTLAMQKSDELAETAAVLFQQLIHLGIAPNRIYISIIEDKNGQSEFWITDEDGSKVSTAFHTNLNDNPTFQKMFGGWIQEKKSLVIDMQGAELQEYFGHLESIHVPFKGGLTQVKRVQHLAYFSKGFIGIASPEDQPAETMILLERFAAVFNLSFTRFNDLKLAEAHAIQAVEDLIKLQTEKQRAEDALTNLQAAQKQLVQSEKMASLGELTAGIAHEIQNPLNFVNNFSEVSTELVDEMNEEIEKGNLDDAKQIAQDLKQNLEKINHHGKRAGEIVKGMLQHSRTSTGQKELTDINALADEYLRLAYHGLRAKDKTFNAAMKTDYDENIGLLKIIPQDIGRVILNLLTNAFYAVNEKKKMNIAGYEPVVSVTTKKLADRIEVRVKDNGNGIPEKVLDKIFQPFFTTKPTGQGTGLGLSLSYDIVKAHGGEIKVETLQNQGTTFIIHLPQNKN